MRRSFRTRGCFCRGDSQGCTLGWYARPISGPLTDGVESVLDREVYFPLAGYAGPGFHTWPGSADVLVGEYETGDSHPKKMFGETFGAATGVSEPVQFLIP